MEKLNILIDKLSRKISGGIFGLLSITFGSIGDLIAYLMYPGYDFTRNSVSSLCDGSGGLFFQVGTVFSGLFALLFVIYLGRTFNEEKINGNLKKYTIIVAIISCISCIILGAFCGSNPIVAVIHGVSAFISWLFGLLYITLFNILMLKDPKYSKFLSFFGFIVSFGLFLLMIMFFLYYIPGLQVLVVILPSLEWIDTIAVIFWYLVISIYIILKKI